MAAKPETRLYQRINNKLSITTTAEKTHNPYRAGIADFYYDTPHGDGWCEYKYQPTKFKVFTFDEAFEKLLSSNQRRWMKQRKDNGRRVCIIVGFKDGGISIAHPTLSTDRPYTARETAEWIENIWLKWT